MWGPVIEGSLITLAPVEPEHLPDFVRWSRDPRGMRYLGMVRPLTMADEEQWYKRMTTSETDIVWAILRDGQMIGNTALHAIDWRNRNAISGIWIGEVAQHGKGYGGEAMRLRTAYAFNELGLEKVMTMIFAENEASRRAAERAGYRQCGLRLRHAFREGRWLDQWLGEVLREDWLALQTAQ
jgi:RimJ/RimL family protein N-acetyltransferase